MEIFREWYNISPCEILSVRVTLETSYACFILNQAKLLRNPHEIRPNLFGLCEGFEILKPLK